MLVLFVLLAQTLSMPRMFWEHIPTEATDSSLNGSTIKCLKSLIRIVEHIKNVTFSQEVLQVIYNTGKMFNDVGYYDSCMQTGNLTYYLVRPLREDLQWKFNYGLCLPKACSQEDANILIVQDIINKRYLDHIAQGTPYTAADFTSTATVVETGQTVGTAGNVFSILALLLASVSVVFGIIEWIAYIRKNKKKQNIDGREEADIKPEQKTDAEKEHEEEERKPFSAHLMDCFNVAGTFRYLRRGRKSQFDSVNFTKFACCLVLTYSSEYIRRQFIGTNWQDKMSIERTKGSVPFNLVYFSSIGFDIFFFLGGLVGAISLTNGLLEIRLSSLQVGAREYFIFYLTAVARRFLRLAPFLYGTLYFYYNVIPGTLSGPFAYLFATTYSTNCSSTYELSFSFVANIFKGTEYCMGGWTWYIFSDMQLFTFLPLFVILMDTLPFVGTLSTISVIMTSLISSGAVFGIDDLTLDGTYASPSQYTKFMDDYQSRPWNKACFYFFGAWVGRELLLRGHRLKKGKNEQKFKKEAEIKIGSIVSLPRSLEGDERFNQLDLGDRQLETVLLEEKNKMSEKQKYRSEMAPYSSGVEPHGLPDQTDASPPATSLSWVPTFLTILLFLGVLIGSFIGFLEYSRSRDNWSSILQVGFGLFSRVAIVGTLAVVIWKFERETSVGWYRFTQLGLLTSFALGYYLLLFVYIEWGMSTGTVSQYYDSIMVFCYAMTDGLKANLPAVLVGYFIEIPFRRIVRF